MCTIPSDDICFGVFASLAVFRKGRVILAYHWRHGPLLIKKKEKERKRFPNNLNCERCNGVIIIVHYIIPSEISSD